MVGDRVTKGETIAEIETDKAVVELAADVDGILGTIVAVAGSIAPVNSTIAVLFLAGESAQRSMTNDGLIASKDPLGAAENIPTRSASEPVSYTHLDVYKRQSSSCMPQGVRK